MELYDLSWQLTPTAKDQPRDRFYTWTTPNGRKISIALEEMGLPYTVHAVDIGKDEQFKPEFLKISPNNRIPAIVDRDNGLSLMELGAILIYLADKCGKLLPKSGEARYRTIEWLMWQMGGPGPMLGQVHHFVKYNKGKAPYAEERYTKEAHRLYGVMNKRLADHEYLADQYSIADIAVWPWISRYEWQKIDMKQYPNVHALVSRHRQEAGDPEGLQGAQGRRRGADPEVTAVAAVDVAAIAAEALAAIDGGRQIPLFSARHPGFSLDDAARAGAACGRRGWRAARSRSAARSASPTAPSGPNTTSSHPIGAPCTTARCAILPTSAARFRSRALRRAADRARDRVRPRRARRRPSMDDASLLATLDWVAHGFEIVQSIVSELEILAGRHGGGQRPAWRAADRPARSGRRQTPIAG